MIYGRRTSSALAISTTRRIWRNKVSEYGVPKQVKVRAYVDRPEAGTVPCSHVLIEALDCISAGEFTELLVHVVGSRARVVAEPDTEVLDLQWLGLVNLYIISNPVPPAT